MVVLACHDWAVRFAASDGDLGASQARTIRFVGAFDFSTSISSLDDNYKSQAKRQQLSFEFSTNYILAVILYCTTGVMRYKWRISSKTLEDLLVVRHPHLSFPRFTF